MDDSLSKEQNISMADINPKRLLNGSTSRLIDEWQIAPKHWDVIRFEVDPSIACASLGIGPNDLINDLKTLGSLLETLCVRDLRVYAQSLNGEVYHYRDKDNQEVDAVIHLRNGKYGLIEIKLGGDKLIKKVLSHSKLWKEKSILIK